MTDKYLNTVNGKVCVIVSDVDGLVGFKLESGGVPHYLGRSEFDKRFRLLPEAHPLAKFGSTVAVANGLYRVHWKSGGSSLAAIGMMENGDRWIAPTNWLWPGMVPSAGEWGEIDRLEPIDTSPSSSPCGIELTLTRTLGGTGAAYDPPGPQRAYTYEHQPHNGPAYSLGCALSAANHEGGDTIDAGLYLLKALQARGFGVFEIEPATPTPQATMMGSEPIGYVYDIDGPLPVFSKIKPPEDRWLVLADAPVAVYAAPPVSNALPPAVTGQIEIEPDVTAADLGANAEPTEDDACPACGGSGRVGPFFPGGLSTICGNCTDPSPETSLRVSSDVADSRFEIPIEWPPVSIMVWQPIATAPKDGTEIILFCPQGDGTPGKIYRITSGQWFIPPTFPNTPDPEVDDDEPPAWLSWDGGFSEETMMPTHWMPLPAPPALSATATEGK